MNDLVLEVKSNVLELRELIEDSNKYDILVKCLKEIVKEGSTYNVLEKLELILKCLGEMEEKE